MFRLDREGIVNYNALLCSLQDGHVSIIILGYEELDKWYIVGGIGNIYPGAGFGGL